MTELEQAVAAMGFAATLCATVLVSYGAIVLVDWWRNRHRRPKPPLPWQVGMVYGNTVYGVYNIVTREWYVESERRARWQTHQFDRAQDLADYLNEGV